jgi:hypothetical protein
LASTEYRSGEVMKHSLWLLVAVVVLAGVGCSGKDKGGEVPKTLMTPPKEDPKIIGMRPKTR